MAHYPLAIVQQVQTLISEERLGDYLRGKYPDRHQHNNDDTLYNFTSDLKDRYLKRSKPLSKALYDERLDTVKNALGTHTRISRSHGGKLKSKNEIRIAFVFKNTPIEFLNMIVVHELAHFKEHDHNKAFYQLCCHMEPDYHELELDVRLYLLLLDSGQSL
ncbi:MAG: M48 family metallopeptidase [Cocleimonas sp.]